MGSKKANGRSTYTPGGYVSLDGYMLDSDAWKSLSPRARCLYMTLKRRYRPTKGRKISNNGKIPLSHREAAAATGFCESAVGNAFRDLVDKGFIKIVRESVFTMKDARAREYALTEFGVGGALSTREFLKWTLTKTKHGTV